MKAQLSIQFPVLCPDHVTSRQTIKKNLPLTKNKEEKSPASIALGYCEMYGSEGVGGWRKAAPAPGRIHARRLLGDQRTGPVCLDLLNTATHLLSMPRAWHLELRHVAQSLYWKWTATLMHGPCKNSANMYVPHLLNCKGIDIHIAKGCFSYYIFSILVSEFYSHIFLLAVLFHWSFDRKCYKY